MRNNNRPKGFERAKKTAQEFARDKEKTKYLLDEAVDKAERHKKFLQGIWSDLQALIRMLRAWIRGEYRQVPWQTIVFAIAGIVYFVNPFDLIPDFIPGSGFLDDATVLGFVIKSIKNEVDQFLQWERAQKLTS